MATQDGLQGLSHVTQSLAFLSPAMLWLRLHIGQSRVGLLYIAHPIRSRIGHTYTKIIMEIDLLDTCLRSMHLLPIMAQHNTVAMIRRISGYARLVFIW